MKTFELYNNDGNKFKEIEADLMIKRKDSILLIQIRALNDNTDKIVATISKNITCTEKQN